MKISVKQGKWSQKDVEALFVPIAEKEPIPKGLPKTAEELLKDALARKEFAGKAREFKHFVLPTGGKKGLRFVFFLGVGKMNDLKAKDFGELLGQALRHAQTHKVATAGFWFRDALAESFSEVEHLSEIIGEYAMLASYEYSAFLKKKHPRMKQMIVYVENKKELASVSQGVKAGALIAEQVNESREVANHPSNEITPKQLAAFAKEAGKKAGTITVKVLGEKEMKELGMGAILGVSRGSAEEAQFIIMEYWGTEKSAAPYIVIGKGITFDTGGISIKPSSNMHEMKFDMSGGTAAIAIVRAAAALKLPLNVVALVPASENMPGHEAYKPGDILRAMDGSTIEVLNTDAEGRLLLADALVYARQYKPKTVIDLATLTGACALSLHDYAAGLFTKNDAFADALEAAGEKTGDHVWRLPLPDHYRKLLNSKVADIANIASVPYGGALTAAAFLNHFVADKYDWAHLDIAGVAWESNGKSHLAPGSTGAGARVVVEWLRQQAAQT